MNNRDGFRRGMGGTFKCACCGRSTRATRETNMTGYCGQCYEIFGLDNTVNDEGLKSDAAASYIAQAALLLKEIEAKGGNIEIVKRNASFVFPKR